MPEGKTPEGKTISVKDALLDVANVTVRFGGLIAVAEVSFTVQSGELLGLIGPNGAGKTTLLRAITGVAPLSSGRVHLDGQRLDGLSIDERIRTGLALSQQLVKPFAHLSLLDNVALAAGHGKTRTPWRAFLNTDSTAERRVALSLLELLGIGAHADRMPATQPLGILKRLELARALALGPKLLLLDEPLAGLNSSEASALACTIASLIQHGTTIVLIEHNLGEVLRICHRLVVLDNGRKIAEGPPQAILSNPLVRTVYLGSHHAAP